MGGGTLACGDEATIEPELARAKTVKMTCYDAMHERNRLAEAIESMASSGRADVKKLLVRLVHLLSMRDVAHGGGSSCAILVM